MTMKGMVKLSNQRTPNDSRNRRRYEDNTSRSVFLDDNEKKKDRKLKTLFSKDTNKEDSLKPSSRRRDYDSENKIRGLSRNDYKPIHVFEEDVKGDTERRKSRSRKSGKTIVLFGASLLIFVAAVIGSFFLFSDNGKDESSPLFSEMASLSNKNRVIIYHDSKTIEVFTNAETVGEVFSENDIVISDELKSSHNEESIIENNMEIFINNPLTVSVIQNDIRNSVTVYGGKVADVFAEMEIDLEEHDIVEPSVDTVVTDQMTITFTDVEIKEISVVEDMPYGIEEGETDTVESGYYHVEEEGKKGTVKVTYKVKYVNNEEQSREEISREVVEEPTARIVLWGTATPSSSNSGGGDGGNYDDITVKNPGEQATNPSVPASPSDYIETMSGHVTAYTHTGRTTATGTWPRSTRTLDNPGSCAVVPGTIPYGSLLYVTGYGYCIAEDTGAFRHDPDRWNQIDLFMNTEDECWTWGRRRDVKVYILRKGY